MCDKCEIRLPENGDFVTCAICDKKFHYNCSVRETKWRNMSVDLKSKWACVGCKGSGSVSRVNSVNSNISEMDSQEEEDVSVKTLLLRMNTRLDALDEVKSSVGTMSKSMAFLSEKYDELLEEMRSYRKDNDALKKEVEQLKLETKEKDKALVTLTRRFNALEQYGRGINLEIHGLEQKSNDEHPHVILKKIAASIGVPFNQTDIQAAHRIDTRRRDQPPMLLVQFVSKATKQVWLSAGKRKKLRSKDIVEVGDQRVYFNENLTPFYGKLFREARLLARDKGYESAWVMNGSIRVKKNREARTIIITDYEDLKLIV